MNRWIMLLIATGITLLIPVILFLCLMYGMKYGSFFAIAPVALLVGMFRDK